MKLKKLKITILVLNSYFLLFNIPAFADSEHDYQVWNNVVHPLHLDSSSQEEDSTINAPESIPAAIEGGNAGIATIIAAAGFKSGWNLIGGSFIYSIEGKPEYGSCGVHYWTTETGGGGGKYIFNEELEKPTKSTVKDNPGLTCYILEEPNNIHRVAYSCGKMTMPIDQCP